MNEVRRRDRAQDDAWIRAFLARGTFGFLASVADGQPFLNSNLYVYDEAAHAIFLHTARLGRTQANAALEDRVAFSVAVHGRLLPAREALEFSVEYASVVVFGRSRVVEDAVEKQRVLELLLGKYAPHLRAGRDYEPITPAELRRTAVLRIDIDAWSGKQKAAPADLPGAFDPARPSIPFDG